MTKKTNALVRKAKSLRAKGLYYWQIGEKLGVHECTVITWFKPEQVKKMNAERRLDYVKTTKIRLEPRPPEADYRARLAEIPPDTRNLSQRLMGEPVKGRSALDRKQA